MIPGYDDYHERIRRGLPAYTHEGLIKKIDALNDEIATSRQETGYFRDELTEILKMEWKGGVCPDDMRIIAELKQRLHNDPA